MRNIILMGIALASLLGISSWVTAESFDPTAIWNGASAMAERLLGGMPTQTGQKILSDKFDARIAGERLGDKMKADEKKDLHAAHSDCFSHEFNPQVSENTLYGLIYRAKFTKGALVFI